MFWESKHITSITGGDHRTISENSPMYFYSVLRDEKDVAPSKSRIGMQT